MVSIRPGFEINVFNCKIKEHCIYPTENIAPNHRRAIWRYVLSDATLIVLYFSIENNGICDFDNL